MPPSRRSSRSERDNNNTHKNNQNQQIDEVEFQSVFLFLFGIYAFAALLSRNTGPRVPNSDINTSIYRSSATNRVDRSPGSAARAGPLVPYARPASAASAASAVPPTLDLTREFHPAPVPPTPPAPPARAVPPAPAWKEPPPAPPFHFIPGPAPPSMTAAPAPAWKEPPPAPPFHFIPGPAPPSMAAAPAPPTRALLPAPLIPSPPQEIHPLLRGPAHQDRDAAHNNRRNYDPNQIIEELGGHTLGNLLHAETFWARSGNNYGDIIGALHGLPDDNQIHNRQFIELGEQEENAVVQRQRGGGGVAAAGSGGEVVRGGGNWVELDPPGCYPAHLDKMGPQFAPFRQDRGPEPPRLAQPPASGQLRGNGIADVVVVDADGAFDPYFRGTNIGNGMGPGPFSGYGRLGFLAGEGDVEGWVDSITNEGAEGIIEISDDEGASSANNDSQGVRGRRPSPLHGTKRGRSSSGSPSSRATKRTHLEALPPPLRRGGTRRRFPRSSRPEPPPAGPYGLPSPPDSQALARRQGAQVGLQGGVMAQPHARPARPMNYVPEVMGLVRDPFDLLCGPMRQFETLTDLEKTDLVLNYCSETHSRYIPFTRPKYHLGVSEDMAYRFSLQVLVYRNGDVETSQNAVEFFKCHPLHRAGSTKVSHSIPTSHLPRKPPRHYTEEELLKCDRGTREKRELMHSPSTPGYAGSEYPHPQSVLRHKVTTYSHMDHWEFQLWSAEAAGPTIFSLRSAYNAATRGNCLLTARLSYEGKEIAQCCMSALEDIQRGYEHEGCVADSPNGYGSLMSIGRDI